MPRTGMGQKGQAVRTATGQEYGQATQQEQAQEVAPLPDDLAPTEMPTRAPRQERAGSRGSPFRPTERSLEDVGATPPIDDVLPNLPPQRARLIAPAMHMMYTIADNAYSDPELRSFVRRMENFIPAKYEPLP
tara:strand:- start:133 stop:531 length:399 start_codon:yes stop_codon:yes gene_type:complete